MAQSFIPETPKDEKKVPYFEDAKREDGWQGHTTTKSIKTLQAEISNSISRLGGMVSSFRKGKFGNRDGFQILYMIDTPNGAMPGKINIAALPLRSHWSDLQKREKALRMALYMLREALDGTWMLEQLSPGYAPLMPFMIGKDNKTISELWSDSAMMSNLLPSGDKKFDDAVEGQIV